MPKKPSHHARGFVITLFVGLMLLLAQIPPVAATSTLLPPSSLPAGSTEATFTYCTAEGVDFQLDLYHPSGTMATPVVVNVHGGGWTIGNRTTHVTAQLVSDLLSKGIAFATIEYKLFDARMASKNVACAVRYLRASASVLHINGARIGVMGDSAGGQLVSLLGTNSAGFKSGQYAGQSSRVQAVADEWGPVIFDAQQVKLLHDPINYAFRTTDLKALKAFSPLTYISRDDPPFLLIHGAADDKVPVSQSKRFAAALKKVGVSAKLVIVPNTGHYLNPLPGQPSDPAVGAKLRANLVGFFDSRLNN